jgi:ribosome recycling factor
MLIEISKDATDRMSKTIDHLKHEFQSLRTGRASVSMVESVKVDYYGTMTPLNQTANISVPEARMIMIQPWDKSLLSAIEKAILSADLGLNPTNDGSFVRVPIPTLTDERRKDIIRHLHKIAEEGRVGIRNVRRDTNDQIKKSEKDNELSEDNSKRAQANIQEITNEFIKMIDEMVKNKEIDINTV